MNKLYCIKWTLTNGYVIDVFNTFSESAALAKIAKNPEWTFEVIEDNKIHRIYIAR